MQVTAAPKRDWTVLYYLNGNNDLQPDLVRNLIDVEKVGPTDQVTIVAQLSRAPEEKKSNLDGSWTGMRRYEISQSSGRRKLGSKPIHVQAESPNHGESATLADFLEWGMKNYPAKHTMLVIGDHGKGYQGTGFDYLHKDVLDLKEFQQSLAGHKPDLLVMDACEMGAVEVAYQLRDSAKILVASEEIVGTKGLPHKDFLGHLIANPKQTPQQLAKDLIRLSADDTMNLLDKGKAPAAEQLAAIRLDRMQPLTDSLAELGRKLATSSIPRAQLKGLIEETQHFNLDSDQRPDCDYRDIAHFCRLLSEEVEDSSIQAAARKVEKALSGVLLANHNAGEELMEGNGLSVYLPSSPIQAAPTMKSPGGKHTLPQLAYQELEFDRTTGWSQWLEKYFG